MCICNSFELAKTLEQVEQEKLWVATDTMATSGAVALPQLVTAEVRAIAVVPAFRAEATHRNVRSLRWSFYSEAVGRGVLTVHRTTVTV
jgi:hypothetical protein